jgi:hypothetical protein
MNFLCLLERWDRWFESHSRHGCLYCVRLFRVCVILCVGRGLATGWSRVQGVLPSVYRIKKLKKRPRLNKGLQSHNNNNNNSNNLSFLIEYYGVKREATHYHFVVVNPGTARTVSRFDILTVYFSTKQYDHKGLKSEQHGDHSCESDQFHCSFIHPFK